MELYRLFGMKDGLMIRKFANNYKAEILKQRSIKLVVIQDDINPDAKFYKLVDQKFNGCSVKILMIDRNLDTCEKRKAIRKCWHKNEMCAKYDDEVYLVNINSFNQIKFENFEI